MTEMDCASMANELSMENELNIIMMGCKLLIVTFKSYTNCDSPRLGYLSDKRL